MSSQPNRVVDVFLQYLKAEKVDTVFGIVGGLAFPFFDAVERDPSMRLVSTRHEEGAAFMADGYARVGRRLGVCAGTGGPGSTNLITGVACAFADGVPMLVLTGQAATHALGRGAAQETSREDIDIVSMFRPITKYSAMVTNTAAFSHHVRRALRLALTGRPGPVHLNVPVDLWERPLDEEWFRPDSYRPTTNSFDRQAVQRAGELLLEARNPVFLAGGGVAIAGAEDHLAELAHLVGARVATTPRGKGVFPEDDAASLGVLGVAGHRAARETILGDSVDVLFTVGASLNETSTFNWNRSLQPSRALIQLDVDSERIGRNYPVDVSLVGDAQTVLLELTYQVHRRIREGAKANSEWHRWTSIAAGDERYATPQDRSSLERPLKPQRWRAELDGELPSNAVVFSDIGGHMLFNIHDLCIKKNQRFIINMGFGSMGHGTVAPIGAAMASKSPIFAIIGDACFAMNGMELLTAVEYSTKVIWIVENNQMHGITWHCSKILSGGRGIEAAKMRIPVDIAAIARAMGVSATTVDSPNQIGACIRQALARSESTLIEVRVDPQIVPPLGERAQSLAGFIER